ncbi:MAG TPA: hypothetical protein VGS23_06990 [Thermoplasmata archaeon]|nr:hypothetical protein [Thermoplasmata archaeon]
MLTRAKFDEALGWSSEPGKRIAVFGALLAHETGLGPGLVITGGSAMTIYSENRISSDDVDVVGDRRKITPILKRWGFTPEEDPDDGRVYWRRDDLSLAVDIIHRSGKAGPGRPGSPQMISTGSGIVYVAAVEDLIVRRLVFWSREGNPKLLDHAVLLFFEYRSEIDLEYLEGEVRYERVEAAYRELRRLAESSAGPR